VHVRVVWVGLLSPHTGRQSVGSIGAPHLEPHSLSPPPLRLPPPPNQGPKASALWAAWDTTTFTCGMASDYTYVTPPTAMPYGTFVGFKLPDALTASSNLSSTDSIWGDVGAVDVFMLHEPRELRAHAGVGSAAGPACAALPVCGFPLLQRRGRAAAAPRPKPVCACAHHAAHTALAHMPPCFLRRSRLRSGDPPETIRRLQHLFLRQ
jgi:hypothetical protein